MHKIEKTHLLTSERGIKCCRVDISKEQSNIILAPLNCSTWHGAELVLPKEYCKTKWNNPRIKQRKIIIIKLVRISSLYAYQLHSFLLFSQRFFKIIQTLIEPPFWIIIINRWTKWLTKPSPPEKKLMLGRLPHFSTGVTAVHMQKTDFAPLGPVEMKMSQVFVDVPQGFFFMSFSRFLRFIFNLFWVFTSFFLLVDR